MTGLLMAALIVAIIILIRTTMMAIAFRRTKRGNFKSWQARRMGPWMSSTAA